jgi:hypothetical protein
MGQGPGAGCGGAIQFSGISLGSHPACSSGPIGTVVSEFVLPTASERGLAVLRPRAGSQAIDAASDCLDLQGDPVAKDQSGRIRPQDGNEDGTAACDLGAIEFAILVFRDGLESG